MEATHRMKVKIGPNEFEAEGKTELVKKQYDEFIAIVTRSLKASATVLLPDSLPQTEKKQDAVVGRSKLPHAILDAVFRKGEPLSLMDRLKTDNADADALLLLVYGHTEMLGPSDVTAATLAKSAKQTGVNVERISRTIATHDNLIKISGAKKGTRYALNNVGIAEAEKLIIAIAKK